MKKLGFGLIAVGFVSGALVSVMDEQSILWGYFVLAMAVGTVGVGLVHLADRQRKDDSETLEADLGELLASLDNIVGRIRELNRDKEAIDPYEIRHHIDDQFSSDLKTFVDARESLGHVYGLEAYADVMMHFAAGERYLNRVWSASADGYVDEVHTYLQQAEEQFQRAQNEVDKLHNPD
jgi:hypothetical protein